MKIEIEQKLRKILALLLALMVTLTSIDFSGIVTVFAEEFPGATDATADFIKEPDAAIKLLNKYKTGTVDSTYSNGCLYLNGVDFTSDADVAVILPTECKIVIMEGTENFIKTTSNSDDSCAVLGTDNIYINGEGYIKLEGGKYGLSISETGYLYLDGPIEVSIIGNTSATNIDSQDHISSMSFTVNGGADKDNATPVTTDTKISSCKYLNFKLILADYSLYYNLEDGLMHQNDRNGTIVPSSSENVYYSLFYSKEDGYLHKNSIDGDIYYDNYIYQELYNDSAIVFEDDKLKYVLNNTYYELEYDKETGIFSFQIDNNTISVQYSQDEICILVMDYMHFYTSKNKALIIPDNTVIYFNGSSVIQSCSTSEMENSYGVFCEGNVKFLSQKTDVSQKITSGKAKDNSYGIYCTNELNITNSIIFANGGQAKNSYGIYAQSMNIIKVANNCEYTGGTASESSYGAYITNSLYLEGAQTIQFVGGRAGNTSCGLHSNNLSDDVSQNSICDFKGNRDSQYSFGAEFEGIVELGSTTVSYGATTCGLSFNGERTDFTGGIIQNIEGGDIPKSGIELNDTTFTISDGNFAISGIEKGIDAKNSAINITAGNVILSTDDGKAVNEEINMNQYTTKNVKVGTDENNTGSWDISTQNITDYAYVSVSQNFYNYSLYYNPTDSKMHKNTADGEEVTDIISGWSGEGTVLTLSGLEFVCSIDNSDTGDAQSLKNAALIVPDGVTIKVEHDTVNNLISLIKGKSEDYEYEEYTYLFDFKKKYISHQVKESIGIYCNGSLTIEGATEGSNTGTINVSSGVGALCGNGIYVGKNLTISNCTVNSSCGMSIEQYDKENQSYNNSIGYDAAIYANDNITIKSGARVTTMDKGRSIQLISTEKVYGIYTGNLVISGAAEVYATETPSSLCCNTYSLQNIGSTLTMISSDGKLDDPNKVVKTKYINNEIVKYIDDTPLISFDYGDTSIYHDNIRNNDVENFPEEVTIDGLKFEGWYTDRDATGTKITKLNMETEITDNTKLYAAWSKNGQTVHSYSIDLKYISQDNTYGSTYNRIGNIFTNDKEGWSWNALSRTLTLSDSSIYSLGSDALILPDNSIIIVKDGTTNSIEAIQGIGIKGGKEGLITGQKNQSAILNIISTDNSIDYNSISVRNINLNVLSYEGVGIYTYNNIALVSNFEIQGGKSAIYCVFPTAKIYLRDSDRSVLVGNDDKIVSEWDNTTSLMSYKYLKQTIVVNGTSLYYSTDDFKLHKGSITGEEISEDLNYSGTSDTLTLDGFNYTTSMEYGLVLPKGVTLELAEGSENTITCNNYSGYAIYQQDTDSINIKGSGKLNVISDYRTINATLSLSDGLMVTKASLDSEGDFNENYSQDNITDYKCIVIDQPANESLYYNSKDNMLHKDSLSGTVVKSSEGMEYVGSGTTLMLKGFYYVTTNDDPAIILEEGTTLSSDNNTYNYINSFNSYGVSGINMKLEVNGILDINGALGAFSSNPSTTDFADKPYVSILARESGRSYDSVEAETDISKYKSVRIEYIDYCLYYNSDDDLLHKNSSDGEVFPSGLGLKYSGDMFTLTLEGGKFVTSNNDAIVSNCSLPITIKISDGTTTSLYSNNSALKLTDDLIIQGGDSGTGILDIKSESQGTTCSISADNISINNVNVNIDSLKCQQDQSFATYGDSLAINYSIVIIRTNGSGTKSGSAISINAGCLDIEAEEKAIDVIPELTDSTEVISKQNQYVANINTELKNISIDGKTYDGKIQQPYEVNDNGYIDADKDIPINIDDLNITYVGIGNTVYPESSTAPVNAGSYKMKAIANIIDTHYYAVSTKEFSIDKQELKPSVSSTISKTYDGNSSVEDTDTVIALTGIVGTDDVSATGTFSYQTSDAGDNISVNVSDIILSGDEKDNYSLSYTSLEEIGTIIPKTLSEDMVGTLETQIYTGKNILPEIKITDGEIELIKNTDYEFNYSNNINIHDDQGEIAPCLTITGINNYQGTLIRKFAIDYLAAPTDYIYGTLGTNGWYTGDVTVSKDGYTVSTNGIDYSEFYKTEAEGETKKTLYFKDAFGHLTDGQTFSVMVDKESPVFTETDGGITITPINSNWNIIRPSLIFNKYQTQIVNIKASDTTSGVDSCYYYIDYAPQKILNASELSKMTFTKGSLFTMNVEGSYVVYAYAVDKAGNRSAYICSDGIVIDNTAPNITVTAPTIMQTTNTSGTANIKLSESGTIICAASASEQNITSLDDLKALTGWQSLLVTDDIINKDIEVTFSGLSVNTYYNIYALAVDTAGNFSVVSSSEFTTKKSQPVITTEPDLSGTYGDSVDDMSIVDGTVMYGNIEVDGTWEVTDANSSNIPHFGTSDSYELTFTPYDENTYYSVTTNIVPIVNKRNITVTIDNSTRKYGEDNEEFTYQITEGSLTNGDSSTVLGIELSTTADETSDVTEDGYVISGQFESTDYNVTIIDGKLTIEKANSEIYSNTNEITKEYLDATLNIVDEAEISKTGDGLITFTSSNESVATVDNEGIVTIVGVGSTTITLNMKETSNYNTAESEEILITVNKSAIPAVIPDASMEVEYSTKTVGEIDLPTNWEWSTEDYSKELNVEESLTATANYIGTDKDNYETITAEVAITRLAKPNVPEIRGDGDKYGWDAISEVINEAAAGDTVIVDMKDFTEVPGDVIESIKGSDITLEIDLGNGAVWKINGMDVTEENIDDIDFAVTIGSEDIPVDIFNSVTGDYSSVQISLAYNGQFGFKATLEINLNSDNEGLYANLYYYNESTDKMEFINVAVIGKDGIAKLEFSHASEYAIVIADKDLTPTQEDIPPLGNNTDIWKYIWAIVLCGMLIIIGYGRMIVKKKNS